jgi:hypothetical protein
MTPRDFLEAARVPHSLKPQQFGLWEIKRLESPREDLVRAAGLEPIGWPDYTVLMRTTLSNLQLEDGHIVMEDSARELRRHLPIWMRARGRVLITGLGLGCVVRGLLASPAVEHVDVVEIDPLIMRHVGAEFRGSTRCTLHRADALKWQPPAGASWDFAWHDLWFESSADLHCAHVMLFRKFKPWIDLPRQGARAFPREIGRQFQLLGAPR